MSGNNITSANAVFILAIPALGIIHQLQGFAVDNAFDVGEQDIAENLMGVDGKKSSGWIPQMYTQAVHLQADSDSIAVFDQVYNFSNINRTFYEMTGTLTYPSTGKSYTFKNGTLTSYKPLPDAKKTLEPIDFSIVWETVIPSVI
jgi:hypothetical protein